MRWADARLLVVLNVLLLGGALRVADRLWWDSAVYIGMGKFLWSLGNAGLWEAARPPLLPVVTGLGWLAGIDVQAWAVLVSLAFAIASVIALFLLLKEETNRNTAFLFALLFALSPLTVRYAPKLLADIPALSLALLSLLLLFRKKDALAGGMLSLAILAKFTSVLYAPAFLLGIFLRRKSLQDTFPFALAAGAVLAPYALWQWIVYANPLRPFIEGQQLILSVAGTQTCTTSALFYVESLLLLIPLSVLAFYGLGKALAKWQWKDITIAAAFLLVLAYHSLALHCKDERYLFAMLPFALILAAMGYEHLRVRLSRTFALALLAAVGLQVLFVAGAYVNVESGSAMELPAASPLQEGWSSTPFIAVENDIRVTEMLYYPVWSSTKAEALGARLHETDYVYLNTCDIPCLEKDAGCEEVTQAFISQLQEEFAVEKHEENNCTIYEARR